MAERKRIRVSPAGPRVIDAVSGSGLQCGNGTPGLMWRSQGADPAAAAEQFDDVALTELPELTRMLGPADVAPGGYVYDIEVNLWLVGTDNTYVGLLHLSVEAEVNNSGTWLIAQNQTGDVLYNYRLGAPDLENRCVYCGNIRIDRTAAITPITGVRVRAFVEPAPDAQVPFYQPQLCSWRLTQYVDG